LAGGGEKSKEKKGGEIRNTRGVSGGRGGRGDNLIKSGRDQKLFFPLLKGMVY